MDKLVLRPWQALALRLVLGGVFVWAGTAKLVQIPSFVETVAAFDMLPTDWAAPFFGYHSQSSAVPRPNTALLPCGHPNVQSGL